MVKICIDKVINHFDNPMSVTNYSYFRASYNSIIIIIKNYYKHPKDS